MKRISAWVTAFGPSPYGYKFTYCGTGGYVRYGKHLPRRWEWRTNGKRVVT